MNASEYFFNPTFAVLGSTKCHEAGKPDNRRFELGQCVRSIHAEQVHDASGESFRASRFAAISHLVGNAV